MDEALVPSTNSCGGRCLRRPSSRTASRIRCATATRPGCSRPAPNCTS